MKRDLSNPLAPTYGGSTKKKRKVTYSTSKDGNSRKKTVTSRSGKRTKTTDYTYSQRDGGNKKTTTVTKGGTSSTKTKQQKAGKLNRAIQRAQRGSITKKASKANTNNANVPTNAYISNSRVKRIKKRTKKLEDKVAKLKNKTFKR